MMASTNFNRLLKTVTLRPPSKHILADPLPDRSRPVDVNHVFDAAKPSKCVAMIDLWRRPRIVSEGRALRVPIHLESQVLAELAPPIQRFNVFTV